MSGIRVNVLTVNQEFGQKKMKKNYINVVLVKELYLNYKLGEFPFWRFAFIFNRKWLKK